MYTKWFCAQLYNQSLSFFTFSHLPNPFFPPRHSTYQRICPQLNESYGLQQRDHSPPAMPLPDLTTLPREPIHPLTGNGCEGLPWRLLLVLYLHQNTNPHRGINGLIPCHRCSGRHASLPWEDEPLWKQFGCVRVNTFFYLSDMRNGHGAWNALTASSPTLREWCHRPLGPVNAAVLRAWRHGPGAPHTVVTLTPTGRAFSTETPSTRWETLRTATGGEARARVADGGSGFVANILRSFPLSAGSLSASRGQSGHSERLSGKLTHSRHDDDEIR